MFIPTVALNLVIQKGLSFPSTIQDCLQFRSPAEIPEDETEVGACVLFVCALEGAFKSEPPADLQPDSMDEP